MSFVLVTGGTGEIACGVVPLLEHDFDLRLLALDADSRDPRSVQADVLDWDALTHALQGAHAVLHLAVATGHSGVYEDDTFNDQRFDVNVKGTYHVCEAARRAGVSRLVHASSLMVVWGHGARERVAGDAPPRPVGTYALTKMLAEQVVRYYAETQGLAAISLRIAAPLDVQDPAALRGRRVRPQQVPFPDLAQAFARALTVPLTGYQVVTIVSESSRSVWDLEPARRILGYEPTYRLDDLGVIWDEPFNVQP
ncbi:MAG TPA: NAD(P)-dependent oxidoreductase [Gemmataceae bacterium]|nr:NAD(P)-dependent oxidoreductase [Gemmataceae bacterium]